MDKEQLKSKRTSAVMIELDLDEDDRVVELISRDHGLFAITLSRIICTRSPDQLDPNLEHAEAPWEQSNYLPHGSSDLLVARTVLQTKALADILYDRENDTHKTMMGVSWEVLNSLISLRVIKERLDKQVSEILEIVEANLDTYTKGNSPKPLPMVLYYDIEFRSFVNEVRRALSTISNLFAALTSEDFSGGHFHKALNWSVKESGKESILSQMLLNDQRWINVWIAMRIAIEHPKSDKYIEILNFSLEADRTVRLPTWRFIHPDYDMQKPQNLLKIFEVCINNILKFFEDLQIALIDEHLLTSRKIGVAIIEEGDRDPTSPMRLRFERIFEFSNNTPK